MIFLQIIVFSLILPFENENLSEKMTPIILEKLPYLLKNMFSFHLIFNVQQGLSKTTKILRIFAELFLFSSLCVNIFFSLLCPKDPFFFLSTTLTAKRSVPTLIIVLTFFLYFFFFSTLLSAS